MHSVDKKIQIQIQKSAPSFFDAFSWQPVSFSRHWCSWRQNSKCKKGPKSSFFVCFYMSISILNFYSYLGFPFSPCASSYPCRDQACHTKPANLRWKKTLENTKQHFTEKHWDRFHFTEICFSFLNWPQDQYHSPFILEQEDRSLVWIRLAVVMLCESRNRASTIDNCIWTTIHESPLTIDNCI